MLNIKHFLIFDTEAALEHYKSEGVKYVCTTCGEFKEVKDG